MMIICKSWEKQVLENTKDIKELQNKEEVDLTEINQQLARALKTPLDRPTSTELVAVDDTNAQVMVELGDNVTIRNGKIEAIPYLHLRLLDTAGNDSVFTIGWTGAEINLSSDNTRDLVIRGTLDDTMNTILVETNTKATLHYIVSNDIGQTSEGDKTISYNSSYTLTLPIGTTAVELEVQSY